MLRAMCLLLESCWDWNIFIIFINDMTTFLLLESCWDWNKLFGKLKLVQYKSSTWIMLRLKLHSVFFLHQNHQYFYLNHAEIETTVMHQYLWTLVDFYLNHAEIETAITSSSLYVSLLTSTWIMLRLKRVACFSMRLMWSFFYLNHAEIETKLKSKRVSEELTFYLNHAEIETRSG